MSDDDAAIRKRMKLYCHGEVTSDISGLARNEETAEMRRQWFREHVPVPEQIEKLKHYYKIQVENANAAKHSPDDQK